jgi:hypothetical protein
MGLVLPAGEHVIDVNLGNGKHWRGRVIVQEAQTTTVFAGRAPPHFPVKASDAIRSQPSMAPAPPVVVQTRVVSLPRVSAFKLPPLTQAKAVVQETKGETEPSAPTDVEVIAQVTVDAPKSDDLPPTPVVAEAPDTAPADTPAPEPAVVPTAETESPETVAVEPVDTPDVPVVPVADAPGVPDTPPPPNTRDIETPVAESVPINDPDGTEASEPSDDDETYFYDPGQEPGDEPDYDSDTFEDPGLGISIGTSPSWMGTTGWSAIGVGLATLGGAAYTSVLSAARANDANKLNPGQPDYSKKFDDLKKQTETQAMMSNILYPLGSALTITGIVLLILDDGDGLKTGDDGSFEVEADVDLNKIMLRTTIRF